MGISAENWSIQYQPKTEQQRERERERRKIVQPREEKTGSADGDENLSTWTKTAGPSALSMALLPSTLSTLLPLPVLLLTSFDLQLLLLLEPLSTLKESRETNQLCPSSSIFTSLDGLVTRFERSSASWFLSLGVHSASILTFLISACAAAPLLWRTAETASSSACSPRDRFKVVSERGELNRHPGIA